MRDAAYGTLSSDGRYVFSLEEVSHSGGLFPGGRGGPRIAFGNLPQPVNGRHARLAAYDLRAEGKLKWHIGSGFGPVPLRPDTVFLGPPLPLHGQLFVLVETSGEIRLLALEAESGSLLWSQALALVDRETTDMQTFGISPSYADGILVCPTGGGAVVSVDLATQSLLWGCRFGRKKANSDPNVMLRRFGWRGRPAFVGNPYLQRAGIGATRRPPSPTATW